MNAVTGPVDVVELEVGRLQIKLSQGHEGVADDETPGGALNGNVHWMLLTHDCECRKLPDPTWSKKTLIDPLILGFSNNPAK